MCVLELEKKAETGEAMTGGAAGFAKIKTDLAKLRENKKTMSATGKAATGWAKVLTAFLGANSKKGVVKFIWTLFVLLAQKIDNNHLNKFIDR